MKKYSNSSPYSNTPQTAWFLNHWEGIDIPSLQNDTKITLDPRYDKRPDLLSFDLYGRTELWWVFSVRNKDILKDPIYDMKAGIIIFAPDKDDLMDLLNV